MQILPSDSCTAAVTSRWRPTWCRLTMLEAIGASQPRSVGAMPPVTIKPDTARGALLEIGRQSRKVFAPGLPDQCASNPSARGFSAW